MGGAAPEAGQWGRRRLLVTLGLVTLAGALALWGLGYGILTGVNSAGRPASPPRQEAAQAAQEQPSGAARRDAIAAAPMLAVPPQAGRGGTPASTPPPAISIPAASTLGPAQVPTGYPHTAEGAIGQLAAIDAAVLARLSIQQAHLVHAAWSDVDAPPAAGWVLVANLQAFLGSAAGQHAAEASTALVVTPVAAQVKGSDGADWVLACVLLDVQATLTRQARIAYGHCERMQWTGQRWVIAPGPAPARAPSTWPGTDLAAAAGWRTWTPATVGGE